MRTAATAAVTSERRTASAPMRPRARTSRTGSRLMPLRIEHASVDAEIASVDDGCTDGLLVKRLTAADAADDRVSVPLGREGIEAVAQEDAANARATLGFVYAGGAEVVRPCDVVGGEAKHVALADRDVHRW